MKLSDYCSAERGAASRLAELLGVPSSLISQWSSGVRSVPAERCPVIERATGGAVRCEDLRPDVPWDVLRQQVAANDPAAATPAVSNS